MLMIDKTKFYKDDISEPVLIYSSCKQAKQTIVTKINYGENPNRN